MRIAVWHDPPPGGARRAIGEFVRRLAVRHTVDLYALDRPEEPAAPGGSRRIGIGAHRPRRQRRLGFYWNDWLTYQEMQDFERLERRVAAAIDSGGYEVALLSVLRTGEAPAALSFLRTPAAYFCHEPPRRFFEPWCRPEAGPQTVYERARGLWRRPSQALLDRVVRQRDWQRVRHADLILTNSCYTATRIQAVYEREASVCYLGVDTDAWPMAPIADRHGVISVGALEAHKGFDFIIEALGRLPALGRPPLTIVGHGGHPAMPAHLRRLAATHGVRLDLRRGVSDAELAALYRSSALFVFGARYEPFGLVILEAMASGLPVVAVAEGGVSEIIEEGHTGLLVPRQSDAFAAAVGRLLSDPGQRAAMAEAARVRAVDAWSWAAATSRLEGHLEGLARSPAPLRRGER